MRILGQARTRRIGAPRPLAECFPHVHREAARAELTGIHAGGADMQQIEGVVKRKDNPNLSCGVLITKDDDGNRTWKKEGTGGLPLNHNSGVWEYRLQTKNLVFLDD